MSPWTVGGYVATEQFDHTSVLQFLEALTGVQEPNITAWRRQAFGDLTSALGFSNGRATTFPPHLPATISGFWQAETEAQTLPAATIPGAAQTPPVQETKRPRLPSFAYVPGIVGGTVAIFNIATFTLASGLTRGTTNPYGIAATPDGSEVWVTESGTNTVSVISTATNTITTTVIVGIYPHGVAITPNGKQAYAANTGPNTGPGGSETVSVVDVASHTVTRTITVGEAPQVVTVSPDGSLVFVTCADGVYVITTSGGSVGKVREELRNPHGVAVTPDGTQAYVTDTERGQVLVLGTASLRTAGRIPVGRTPWNTAFNADGSSAYVTNANDDTVSVIDTASSKITKTIPLGAHNGQLNHIPTAIALSPEGNIWVTCNVSSSLVVIGSSNNSVIKSIDIALGDGPTGIAFV